MREHEFFVTNDQAHLRVRDLGRGPAVIFLHGWALDLDMWTPQLAELSRSHRVIAFDRRGFGLSSGEPSIAADVGDLHRLFGLCAVHEATIVGMSQGARVAARFAHVFPQYVRCLVLDGPPDMETTSSGTSIEIPLDDYRDRVRRDGLETFKREWSAHPLMRLHTQDLQTHTLLRTMIDRYPGKDLRMTPIEGGRIDFGLHTLTMPVLVINGELDTSERIAAGARIAELIPEAKRSIVPGAGHLPNLDKPAEYNDVLRSFLHACTRCERRSTIRTA